MAYLHDDILDAALSYISTNTENLYICSTEPTSFAEASNDPGSAGYKLGTKASPGFGSLANGDASAVQLLLSMIRFLDTGLEKAQTDIHIYKLENADATVIAQTLSSLAAAAPAPGRQPDQGQPQPGMAFTARFSVVANRIHIATIQ